METHILFFTLAGLLIAILVGYTFWSARREKSRVFSNNFSDRPQAGYESNGNANTPTVIPTSAHTQQEINIFAQEPEQSSPSTNNDHLQREVENIKISLPEQETTHHTPDVFSSSKDRIETHFAHQPPQVHIATAPEPEPEAEIEPIVAEQPKINMAILYVVAPEGQYFSGEHLVNSLVQLGFHYGEYQIFHRHINNPTSPVLFSVANMFEPGSFDLDNLAEFHTTGLQFFMNLPSVEGNSVANLRLLFRTVDSFSQAVGGFVLDDQFNLLDDQARQRYMLQAG